MEKVPHRCRRRAKTVKKLSLPHPVIYVISAEQFIPAVPGERHRNLLPGKAGNQKRRDLRAVSKGLVIIDRKLLNQGKHLFLADIQLRVVTAQIFGHLLCILCLIVLLLVKTDGEGFHRLLTQRLGKSRHKGGIVSSAQKSTDGNVCNHPLTNGLTQPVL